MGRPSKFNSSLSAKIAALYGQGKTDAQVAKALGISRRTIYYWKDNHPEFLHTLKEAKSVADDLTETSLFRRAVGYSHPDEKIFQYEGKIIRAKTVKHYPPDVTAAIFWLKNRRPQEWRESQQIQFSEDQFTQSSGKKSYSEFCIAAGYPEPYPKQIEMMEFGINGSGARMILGARGYGKTDYVVILGIAYKLYLNPNFRVLILTKSKERNAAMLREIAQACKANGMTFEKENSTCLRISGLHGKDHSVSAVTIKTVTLRGRHPDLTVMDDPVTEDDVSEATRNHVQRVYNEINKLCGNILIIGQPVHKFDLYESLRPLLNKMEVPHGSIPELDHDLEAQRLAGVSEESIQASYFLNVLSQGATPFDNIKYINEFPLGDSSVAFIDPSHEGWDYTALSIVRAYMQGVAVVGFTWKRAWNHCIDEMAQRLKEFIVQRVCFETNALGDQPIIMLRQVLNGIGVVGRKSNTNKHSRIMAAGSYAHLIHLSRQSDRTYTDQVIKYEYKAKNDDAPDSLASCLEWLGLIRGKQ